MECSTAVEGIFLPCKHLPVGRKWKMLARIRKEIPRSLTLFLAFLFGKPQVRLPGGS